jgi:integrase/recombinase XerD
MTLLAPTLETFFTRRLVTERNASQNTISAYRDTFRLLLGFAQQETNKPPCQLDFSDIDAPLIGTFLNYLEVERHNSIRTRNNRLAAIRSFFTFAAVNHPEHAGVIQRVLAIGQKRFDRAIVEFLTEVEADALFAAPDRMTWTGRRDHAILVLMAQTGLRVSELTALECQHLQLGVGAHVRVSNGKGRKQRSTPVMSITVATLRVWMAERQGEPDEPLFPSRRGAALSRDSVEHLVNKHTLTASQHCASLRNKTVSPHVLRHTSAMRLLQAGVDSTVIALWLGHESVETTQIYIHADMTIKERAIARTKPPDVAAGHYRPPDTLLAFLEGL